MTIQNVVNQLIILFVESETFSIKDDLIKITIDRKLETFKKSIVENALNEMKEEGLVSLIGDGVWIANQPIQGLPQEVTLSLNTCMLLADTINNFFTAQKIEHDPVNVFDISEQHIFMMIQIIGDLLDIDSKDA